MANISLGIYQLILKMTKDEKVYFKKYSSLSNKQNQIEFALFDLINHLLNRQEVSLDFEEKIKDSFLKKYPKENLAKVKNSLYRKLLENLSSFEMKEDGKQIALQRAIYIQLLSKRGLYEEAWRELKKSEKLLEKIQDYSLKIFFEELKFRIAYLNGNYEILNELTENRIQACSAYFDNLKLVQLHNLVFDALQGKHQNLDEKILEMKKLLATINPEGKEISFQFNFQSLLRNIAFLEKDISRCIFHIEQMIRIYEENSEMFKGQEKVILALYADIISYGFENNDSSYYTKYFSIIRNWKANIIQTENYKSMQMIRLQILHLFFTRRIEDVYSLEEQFFSSIEYFSEHMLMAISDCFVYAYYLLGEHQKISRIMNEQFLLKRKGDEIISLSELISLVLDYESEDFELIESKLKSINTRLEIKEESYTKVVLNFFKKLIKAKKIADKELASLALNELNGIEYISLKYSFDFKIWFEALIENKSYKDIWLAQKN